MAKTATHTKTASGTRKASALATASPLDDAYAGFGNAKKALEEAVEARRTNRRRIGELRTLISDAARAEKFEEAAKLKRERDALESESDTKVTELREAASQAQATLTRLYFEAYPVHLTPTSVTVTRVVVVDPFSGRSVEEVYTDASDNICFSLRDKSFDSEAYHIGEWALEHGFLVNWFKKDIEV